MHNKYGAHVPIMRIHVNASEQSLTLFYFGFMAGSLRCTFKSLLCFLSPKSIFSPNISADMGMMYGSHRRHIVGPLVNGWLDCRFHCSFKADNIEISLLSSSRINAGSRFSSMKKKKNPGVCGKVILRQYSEAGGGNRRNAAVFPSSGTAGHYCLCGQL